MTFFRCSRGIRPGLSQRAGGIPHASGEGFVSSLAGRFVRWENPALPSAHDLCPGAVSYRELLQGLQLAAPEQRVRHERAVTTPQPSLTLLAVARDPAVPQQKFTAPSR